MPAPKLAGADPSDDDLRYMFEQPQRQANARVDVLSQFTPDEAQQAHEYEQDTGIPSAAAINDIKERRNKQRDLMTKLILQDNTHLQDWVNSNPMAAGVAQNDWGTLNNVSKALDPLGGHSVMHAVVDAMAKAWNDRPPASERWFHRPTDVEVAAAKSQSEIAALHSQIADADFAKNYPTLAKAFGAVMDWIPPGMEMGIQGFHAGVKQAAMQWTGMKDTDAEQFADHMAAGLEYKMTDVAGTGVVHGLAEHPPEYTVHRGLLKNVNVTALAPQIEGARSALGAYVRSGEPPPLGLNPVTDQLHAAQTARDAQALDNVFKLSQESEVRERSADLFANLVGGKTGIRSIEVPVDTIRALYGDKSITPDDGILGWVPNIQGQIDAGSLIGWTVKIPLKDMLAKMDPKVYAAIKDQISVRDGGYSPAEIAQHVPAQALESLSPEGKALRDHEDAALSLARQEGGLNNFAREGSPEGFGGPPVGEPPPREGHVRFYHGAHESASEPGEGRWVSPYYDYARNFRTDKDKPNTVWYVDVPKGHPEEIAHRAWDEMDERFNSNMIGRYHAFETSAELAKRMQRIDGTPRQRELEPPTGGAPVDTEALKGKVQQDKAAFDKAEKLTGNTRLEEDKVQYETSKLRWVDKAEKDQIEADRAKEIDAINKDQRTIANAQAAARRAETEIRDPKTGKVIGRTIGAPKAPDAVESFGGEPQLFSGRGRLGRTKEQFARWMRKAQERREGDAERNVEKNRKDIAKRQTKEWTTAKLEEEPKAKAEVDMRPDIRADEYLRLGKFAGETQKGTLRLDGKYLSKEQKRDLHPDHWQNYKGDRKGYHPDDVAKLFQYSSGKAMLERLSMLQQARLTLKQSPAEYKAERVREALADRMEARFGGPLKDNIMREARDHAVSQEQFDMIHEDYLQAAMRAGIEVKDPNGIPITKDFIKNLAREMFLDLNMKGLTEGKMLRNAGKMGALMEDALLKGDHVTAFKHLQSQYLSILMAKEASAFEKRMERLDGQFKTYRNREKAGIEPEYLNWIHYMMGRVGKFVDRTEYDLNREINAHEEKTLKDFVAYKNGMGHVLELPQWLEDPRAPRRVLETLTAREALDIADTIQSFIHTGRKERSIQIGGENLEREEARERLIGAIEHLGVKPSHLRGMDPNPTKWRDIKRNGVSHLQLETVFARWDRDDPTGPWSRIFQQFAQASTEESSLIHEFAKRLRALKVDTVYSKETIENPLFRKLLPGQEEELYDMNRTHLWSVMLNMGTKTNIEKLSKGYGLDPTVIKEWINRNARDEDWKVVETIWGIFKDLKERADLVHRNISGIAPESLEPEPFMSPLGVKSGGFFPMFYSHLIPGTSEALMGGKALFESGFVRAMTPNGQYKRRTGYIAPVDLDGIWRLPHRMSAYIHDIAFREAVINGGKVFYDAKIQKAVESYAGHEYRNKLVPWLKAIANSANANDAVTDAVKHWSEKYVQNTVHAFIDFSTSTVLKHGPSAWAQSMYQVGPLKFLYHAWRSVFGHNEETGDREGKFAVENSQQLQRRMHRDEETLGGGLSVGFREKPISQLRQKLWNAGTWAVAKSDLMSAIPTWLAAYHQAREEGMDHGDAVQMGERAIRQAHGSSEPTSQPFFKLQNQLGPWQTQLYTFFNHMLQKHYEMGWRANELRQGKDIDGWGDAARSIKVISGMLLTYAIVPAVLEEVVSPGPVSTGKKDNESYAWWLSKGMFKFLTGMIPMVREMSYAIANGLDMKDLPSSAAQPFVNTIRDVKEMWKGHHPWKHLGKLVADTSTSLAIWKGFGGAPVGRAAEYMTDVLDGTVKPKGPWQWIQGLQVGKNKGHSPTAYDYFMGTGKVQH